jgi:hypothetical protein
MGYHRPMNSRSLAIVAVLSVLPFSGAAGASSSLACPWMPVSPRVDFSGFFPGQPSIDQGLDPRQMAERATLPLGRTWTAGGLTAGRYETSLEAATVLRPLPDGSLCAQVASVSGRLTYTDFTVYVARTYAPGSCQYEVILGHEMEHVAIHRETYERYLPLIQARLEEAARTQPPFRVRHGGEAAAFAVARLQEAVDPLLAALDAEAKRRNAEIDSPANYHRLTNRCPSW